MNIAFVSIAHLHVDMYLRRLRSLLGGRSAYAVWDEDKARGKGVADREGAIFYDDLDSLLADDAIDAFAICSENLKLLPLLRKVIAVGKPIFCEKPLAVGLEDLAEIREVVEGKEALISTGYFQTQLGALKGAAAVLSTDQLGEVERMSYRNTRPAVNEGWFGSPESSWFVNEALSGGGGFLDLGSHAIHCARSLFGPIARVKAQIENKTGVYPWVDDFGKAGLVFKSGVVGVVEAGWLKGEGLDGLEVWGSRKSLWNTSSGYVIGASRKNSTAIDSLPDGPMRMERLLAQIKGELSIEELKADLNCAFDTIEAMAAAYESSASGDWVELD